MARYYIERGGRAFGPFELEKIREYLNSGTLDASSRVSRDRIQWKPVAEWPDIMDKPATPPPTVVATPVYPSQPSVVEPERTIVPRTRTKKRTGERRRVVYTGMRNPLVRKLDQRFLLSWLFFGISCIVMLIWTIVFATTPREAFHDVVKEGRALFVFTIVDWVIFFLLCLGSFIATIAFLHAFWQAIPKKFARTSSDVAIGSLFLPFWCYYWLFVVLENGASGINEALVKNKLMQVNGIRVSRGLAMVTGAALVAAMVVGTFLGFVLVANVGLLVLDRIGAKPIIIVAASFAILLFVGSILLIVLMAQMKNAAETLINATDNDNDNDTEN